MDLNNTPYDSNSLELLAQIVDRARFDNRVLTQVPRTDLSSDLTAICQIFSATNEPLEQKVITPWDMIEEEHPPPTRSYKIFAKSLATDDPIESLRTLSRDRSPSELYLLQARINSRASSKRPNIEKGLPTLQTADWSALSAEQQTTTRKHMAHLGIYYYNTQKRNTNPMENRINLAVHELAELFARHTHFNGIPTDLPYAATSRFIQFLCLALRPIANPNKLSPDAVSMRWRRLKGPTDNQ